MAKGRVLAIAPWFTISPGIGFFEIDALAY